MRLRLHDHGLISDEVRRIVDHESHAIDRRLTRIDPDLKLLDVRLDHQLRSDTLNARLVLHILDREVAAHGHGETAGQALRQAFANLNDQMDEFLAKLEHEPAIRDEERKPAWLGQPGAPKE
jgi:hypothetical protein